MFIIVDSCDVNNGGCDPNAYCSHDESTFAVVCTCNAGYTNVGDMKQVRCEGNDGEFKWSESLFNRSSLKILAK